MENNKKKDEIQVLDRLLISLETITECESQMQYLLSMMFAEYTKSEDYCLASTNDKDEILLYFKMLNYVIAESKHVFKLQKFLSL